MTAPGIHGLSSFLRRVPHPPVRLWARRVLGALHYVRHGRLPDPQLVGMTSLDEQQYYEACAASLTELNGSVVDLGCWMCSTAISLARGVQKGAARSRTQAARVYAVDRFIWEPWMDDCAPKLSCDYVHGESFLPEARHRSGGLRDGIELIQADLTQYVWQNGSIKILLVDALKSRELARSITMRFFPFLVEGGLVIHQDFKHYYTPWIHLLQYRLRDHFRFAHEVANGSTVAFETLSAVSPEEAQSATQYDGTADEEINAAFDYSLHLVSAGGKSAVAAAHVMHFVHTGRPERAREVLHSYAHLPHPPQGDFQQAMGCVEKMKD